MSISLGIKREILFGKKEFYIICMVSLKEKISAFQGGQNPSCPVGSFQVYSVGKSCIFPRVIAL